MSSARNNRSHPLTFLPAALLAGLVTVAAQAVPVTIDTMAIHEEGERTAVYIDFVGEATWRLDRAEGEQIELWLGNAVPGPAVSDLFPPAGLVESVRVWLDEASPTPSTIIALRSRRPVTASVESLQTGLALRLGADSPATPAAPPRQPPAADVATAEPAPPTPVAASDEGRYRIGRGDVLQVSVFGLDELTRRVRVAPDGNVSLPLLGKLTFLGLTPTEAETSVAEKLSEGQLVNDPQVTIFVEEYMSRGVSIQGAVNRPGVFQMIEQRTLLEMLGEAGGLSGKETERAGQRIFVLRTQSGGGQERIEIDAGQLIDHGDPSLNIPLRPGDVVMVPHAKKLRVYVTGAVERPGHIEYLSSEGITVLQAITAAGGPTERSNLRRVHVLRRGADGAQIRIPVNVRQIQKGRADDPMLESNDTVVVGEWFF